MKLRYILLAFIFSNSLLSNGQPIFYVQYDSSFSISPYSIQHRTFYEYDANGIIQSQTRYGTKGFGYYMRPLERNLFAYNHTGRLAVHYSQERDSATHGWEDFKRVEFQYDLDNILRATVNFAKDSGAWHPTEQVLFDYNPSGLLAEQIRQVPHAVTTWQHAGRTRYVYDSQNRPDSVISQVWDSVSLDWQNAYADVSWYYANRLDTVYRLKWQNNTWEPFSKTSYASRSYGITYPLIEYRYQDTSQLWEPYMSWFFRYAGPSIIWNMSKIWKDNKWEPYVDYHYKYQDGTGISQGQQPDVPKLFPNPATTVINLKLPVQQYVTYTILDMQGKVLGSGNLQGSAAQLQIQNLPSGHYLIQLSGNGQAKVLPFVKQ